MHRGYVYSVLLVLIFFPWGVRLAFRHYGGGGQGRRYGGPHERHVRFPDGKFLATTEVSVKEMRDVYCRKYYGGNANHPDNINLSSHLMFNCWTRLGSAARWVYRDLHRDSRYWGGAHVRIKKDEHNLTVRLTTAGDTAEEASDLLKQIMWLYLDGTFLATKIETPEGKPTATWIYLHWSGQITVSER